MTQPAWDDPSIDAGAMVRGALWLMQVVGEGNVFTKKDLRLAFPNASQIDRRIRDLRDYGWVLLSSAEDATLAPEDQRFVSQGVPVWDAEARKAASPRKALSSKARAAIMARDNYMCTICGIAGGEPYPDDPVRTAVLVVASRGLGATHSRTEDNLFTECRRCWSGARSAVTVDEAIREASSLNSRDRRELVHWLRKGWRVPMEVDRAWSLVRFLSMEDRERVIESLVGLD